MIMTFQTADYLIFLGAILLVIEFFKIPGIGFLFIGLGCITSGAIFSYYTASTNYQIITAGFASLFWLAALWVPLKNSLYNNSNKKKHFNIVGSKVEVAKDIIKGSKGEVYWSGTLMNAQLNKEETENASAGESLYVTKVKGNLLICSRKKPE